MTSHVIDASAGLAYLLDEPGCERVRDHLPSGRMSAVNLAEVVTTLVRMGADPMRAHYLGCEIVPYDAEQADLAGRLWLRTSRFGLSLADRACLALAIKTGGPVLTGDRVWAALDVGVDVILIR
ncbi:type II toxin-antitoxin system VapC family toxin [Brevundimonas sp.]|uniref:type II toxin-antitoxin system VapC family toxin n=1 Tax=Brevundimonas sp. TaxID=1871086 RepID=UPI0025C4C7E4|nr:type II toxin-antitoxin system VapC family toxin [Brevundimonas sp.]